MMTNLMKQQRKFQFHKKRPTNIIMYAQSCSKYHSISSLIYNFLDYRKWIIRQIDKSMVQDGKTFSHDIFNWQATNRQIKLKCLRTKKKQKTFLMKNNLFMDRFDTPPKIYITLGTLKMGKSTKFRNLYDILAFVMCKHPFILCSKNK